MSLSNYLEEKLTNHTLGNGSFTVPTNRYIKLHLADPGEDCTTSPAANTTRVLINFAAWAAGVANATGTPVAEWLSVPNAETYTHFSIWDALTVGNPLGSGPLSSSAAVTVGQTFQITALTWALD